VALAWCLSQANASPAPPPAPQEAGSPKATLTQGCHSNVINSHSIGPYWGFWRGWGHREGYN
jgi:hypothetical protein